jgi:hypothetical protein
MLAAVAAVIVAGYLSAATAAGGVLAAEGPVPGGTQVGLNPGLTAQADNTIHKLVTSIQDSPIWNHGRNIIVIVWDENDYAGSATALTVSRC